MERAREPSRLDEPMMGKEKRSRNDRAAPSIATRQASSHTRRPQPSAADDRPPSLRRPPPSFPSEASKQTPPSARRHPHIADDRPPMIVRRSFRPVPLVEWGGEPGDTSQGRADEPMRTAWAYEASKQDGPRDGPRGGTKNEPLPGGMTRRRKQAADADDQRLCFRLHM